MNQPNYEGKGAIALDVLDHGFVPLALGGSNTDENVQLLCPTCNTSKGSAHPVEYESRIGYRRVE